MHIDRFRIKSNSSDGLCPSLDGKTNFGLRLKEKPWKLEIHSVYRFLEKTCP